MFQEEKEQTSEQRQESNQGQKPNQKQEMVDWWVGTVVLAFFPTIVSVIASLCMHGNVDVNRLIGDGELIISAFLVTTPSLINLYKDSSKNRTYKKTFYTLLFAAFFQLVAYTSIKINPERKPNIVYIASTLCVLSSVLVSWLGEKHLKEEGEQ